MPVILDPEERKLILEQRKIKDRKKKGDNVLRQPEENMDNERALVLERPRASRRYRYTDYEQLKMDNGWLPESEFFNYLNGKRVILVGPAKYIGESKMGEEIDNYDIIVRMNLSCPVPKNLHKHIGSRTDVLYHLVLRPTHYARRPDLFKRHDRKEIEAWRDDGVKWVVLKSHLQWLQRKGVQTDYFVPLLNGLVNWTNIPHYSMSKLTTLTRTPPNMGTLAIYHLLKSNLKSLHVVGCDYHNSGYYVGYGGFNEEQAKKGEGGGPCWGQGKNYRVGRRPIHKHPGQFDYIRDTLKYDKRFTVDDVLMRILKEKAK